MGHAQEIRVLMIEDSAADAELLLRELRRLQRPVRHHRVASGPALHAALDEFAPDIILSDYSMPGFGGHDALEIVLNRAPQTPFVYVSGTIGEERAIEALQRGASDYVLKENLRRLPAAVERALRLAHERLERERMQRALQVSEERFRAIVESSQDWVWENDVELRNTYSNRAIDEILGYRPDELAGRAATELMHEEDRHEVESRMPCLITERRGWRRWRLRWRHRDGRWKVLESSAMPLLDEAGRLVGFRGIDHDITERLNQEARIREFARIHAVLGAIGSSALRTHDRDELLRNACRIAVEQGGFRVAGIGVRTERGELHVAQTYGDSHLIGSLAPRIPMGIEASSAFASHPSVRAFREGRIFTVADFADCNEVPPALCADMLRFGVHSQISLPLGREPWGILALYSDRTRTYDDEELALLRRLAEEIDHAVDFLAKGERLEYLAFHNPASGLPNRAAFHEHLQTRLLQRPVVVAAIDVRGFARINHSRGRVYGEELLRRLAARLQALDVPGAFVAHPEGDTFLVAFDATADLTREVQRFDAVLRSCEKEPIELFGESLHVGLRAGVAMGPLHGADAESLERNAMSALAETPRRQLDLFTYSDDLRDRTARRLELERDLRVALDERQFELHYQPKYHSASRRLTGAEALLRWHRPGHGLVSPAEFIPVLEETGLIVEVGRWVMQQALATALELRRNGRSDLRIAVNVSARELRHAPFLDNCRALLAPYRNDQPIDIEITESVLMDELDHSIRVLEELRRLGCRIAIDDFGTGFSSLNYLVRLPIDTVKVDRSFVSMLTDSPETVALVSNMIDLSHALGFTVVAEGVETDAEADLLRARGCDELQGYLLGRPVALRDFARHMERG
jgi:PAS domain S-box-containing protein